MSGPHTVPILVPAVAAAAPAPAPAPTPAAHSLPASTLATVLAKTIEYTLYPVTTAGNIIGIYFCAREIFQPWQPSHIPVVITLVALSCLFLCILEEFVEWLIEFSCGIKLDTATLGPIYKAFTRFHTVLLVYSLALSSIMATYFITRELFANNSYGLIVPLLLLLILDIVVCRGTTEGICAQAQTTLVLDRWKVRAINRDMVVLACGILFGYGIEWYRKPATQARRKWVNARFAQSPRVTREQAMAEVEQDEGIMV
ncbi:hypothetical protein BU23DRAFT_632187 [Bimuria novae-zelandiae CBS 107.79]|uniref:Uncharacterized protein n=1 Tax=Bimuria novae-zelandiae CBS 107.79 TaxID=1447943 RepID=A0A6A5VEW5_9PLEO|nr:hypothetical protein BU23DRAFT_632187 [Bimuria novae-zelandiae CBS 107.79]